MSRISTRLWIPVIGSFAVYLVPLVGPHAIWLVGESLAQGVADADGPNPWWLAANVVFAFAAQIATGLLLAWTTRGSRLRLLTWSTDGSGARRRNERRLPGQDPVLFPDRARHCAGACRLDGALFRRRCRADVDSGLRDSTCGRRSRVVDVASGCAARTLRLPECALIDAAVPVPALQPGGRVDLSLGFQLCRARRGRHSRARRAGDVSPKLVAAACTVGADDTHRTSRTRARVADPLRRRRCARLDRTCGEAPPYPERVAVRELKASDGLTPHLIDLERFGRASYTLLGVDTVAREVMLWRNDEPVRVGFDGDRRPLGFTPGGIRAQPSTYLRTHDGWVAWDAYRDEGPYQLAWSLAGRSGMHRTNNGRSITSAAVDPTGSFIAISETTTLSVGDARDVVHVIRASDGADVFRRYLPRYARSQVVFFEGGLFAYSDLAGTHVLKLP